MSRRKDGYRGEPSGVPTKPGRLCLARTDDGRLCTRERGHEGKCKR